MDYTAQLTQIQGLLEASNTLQTTIQEKLNMVLGYQEFAWQLLIPFLIVCLLLWAFFNAYIKFRD